MRFTPLTSFNSYITNDIVRFWLPMVKGFWDPYKSYIQLEVQVDQADFPYGTACQVDNSASSFISQMTVFVDSKQVQRVQEYDTIAALLHDMMYMPADKFGKHYEGVGYAQHDSLGHSRDTRRQVSAFRGNTGFTNFISTYGNGASTSTHATNAVDDLSFYCSGYVPQRPLYITPKKVIYPVAGAIQIANANTNASLATGAVQVGSSYSIGSNYQARSITQVPRTITTLNQPAISYGRYANSASLAFPNLMVRQQPVSQQYLFLCAPLD